jgi:hypothetical protein
MGVAGITSLPRPDESTETTTITATITAMTVPPPPNHTSRLRRSRRRSASRCAAIFSRRPISRLALLALPMSSPYANTRRPNT